MAIFVSIFFYGHEGVSRRMGQRILDVIHTPGLRAEHVPRRMAAIHNAMLKLPRLRSERHPNHQRPPSSNQWVDCHVAQSTTNSLPLLKHIELYSCSLESIVQQIFTSPKFLDAGDGEPLFVFGQTQRINSLEFNDTHLNTHYFKYRNFLSFINEGLEYCIGDFVRVDNAPMLFRIDCIQIVPVNPVSLNKSSSFPISVSLHPICSSRQANE